MSNLNWKIPPSEATASHGEYAITFDFGTAFCFYKQKGSENWSAIFETSGDNKEAVLARARDAGDAHNSKIVSGVNPDRPLTMSTTQDENAIERLEGWAEYAEKHGDSGAYIHITDLCQALSALAHKDEEIARLIALNAELVGVASWLSYCAQTASGGPDKELITAIELMEAHLTRAREEIKL